MQTARTWRQAQTPMAISAILCCMEGTEILEYVPNETKARSCSALGASRPFIMQQSKSIRFTPVRTFSVRNLRQLLLLPPRNGRCCFLVDGAPAGTASYHGERLDGAKHSPGSPQRVAVEGSRKYRPHGRHADQIASLHAYRIPIYRSP